MGLFNKSAKPAALRDVVAAVEAATEAINTHGRNSRQARNALQQAQAEVYDARQAGATDAEIRAARGR
ncbi:hypothetical protein [Streptomyces sp. KN37]|uniref:hypothetical protein n=1 Tax=Streptomyces sp. KN37 TaxID=3090667 RepID=UPI002A762119|nr:hypothetical protein [Streptomyces sp. KN37]WPO70222.1 hypothetical protein R9806_06055 [Streptomyces sp. KN37]WPO74007.1 hypothetical protein R9806_27005 [Streptomyces sp. KN37]